MPGRLTLGLWNDYDPRRFAEAHRRALVRAAPLALAFDANLAAFGFPFDDLAAGGGKVAERRGAKGKDARRGEEEAPAELRAPADIAAFLAASTSVGKEAAPLVELAAHGRFAVFPLPERGFPPQLGRPVLTTSRPDPARATTAPALARAVAAGESLLLVFGLGPHGGGKDVREATRADFDVTGRGVSLETATALGACTAAIAYAPRSVP